MPTTLHWGQTRTGGFEGGYEWPHVRVGDLVLFKFRGISRDPVDHVGIYAGDGITIEATRPPARPALRTTAAPYTNASVRPTRSDHRERRRQWTHDRVHRRAQPQRLVHEGVAPRVPAGPQPCRRVAVAP